MLSPVCTLLYLILIIIVSYFSQLNISKPIMHLIKTIFEQNLDWYWILMALG